MECRDVRPLVDAFVSDQLLVETTEAIVAHLERCPACRAEVEGLRRLRAATRSAFANARELEARPEFLSSLHGRLQAEAARQTRVTRPRWTWLAVAASLTLLIMAGTGWREWTVRSLTALVNAAVRDHRFCTLTSTPGAQRMSLEEAARRYGVFNRALETVQPQVDSLDGGPIRILERHSVSSTASGSRTSCSPTRARRCRCSCQRPATKARASGDWDRPPADRRPRSWRRMDSTSRPFRAPAAWCSSCPTFRSMTSRMSRERWPAR